MRKNHTNGVLALSLFSDSVGFSKVWFFSYKIATRFWIIRKNCSESRGWASRANFYRYFLREGGVFDSGLPLLSASFLPGFFQKIRVLRVILCFSPKPYKDISATFRISSSARLPWPSARKLQPIRGSFLRWRAYRRWNLRGGR